MPIKKLLLFDIDGTLLRSNGATRSAKKNAMQEVFGLTGDVLNHPFGGKTDWQILNELLVPLGHDPLDIGKKMPHFEKVFAQHLGAIIDSFNVEALPGALDLVQEMHEWETVMVGLVTGNTSATAPIKLEAAGFHADHFVIGAYGNESDDRNLLPTIALERAAKTAGHIIQPSDTLVIGDTPADVECARAVGAVAITVFTGHADAQAVRDAQPDIMLDDLTQFRDRVNLS